jgi:hypothetical protein
VKRQQVKACELGVVAQFIFCAAFAISLRIRAFKAFDRKGRKEISAKFAKNNERSETAPLPLGRVFSRLLGAPDSAFTKFA